ncbi:MAG: bifunctional serine/threonine-protein kinase/formylglycine-generating enzyme family protein [Gemmatimonadota bacterium]
MDQDGFEGMIGETISHYRIIENLGGGGMGVVFRAHDTRLGRDVALKFLTDGMTRDPEARERFTREARAASALDHANICTIYDIDETDDGRLFIAMAFYVGETLKARLARGPLDMDEAVDLARRVAAGLQRAHESGIVHRDIKPSNLMVTDRGEVKIVDFGIAQLTGEAGLTRTGQSLGTLAYMSPEQIESADVGPAADLWALGAVLYEMVTGDPPFRGKRETELVAAILARDPGPLGRAGPSPPPALETLVMQLLSKEPHKRPSTAGEVERQLGALLVPESAADTPLWRRRAAWIGVAVAALLVAAALVLPARSQARVEAARRALPEIEAMAADGRYEEAFARAVEAEQILGDDPTLNSLMPEVSELLTVRSDPAGAAVRIQSVTGGEPRSLGTTPLVGVRLPRSDYYVVMEKDGYEPSERIASSALSRTDPTFEGVFDAIVDVRLTPAGSSPPGMVPVPGGAYTLVSADAPAGASAELGDFFIDRFEVTNEGYRQFVRAGGYADSLLWTTPVEGEVDGVRRALSWRGAMSRFVDRTNLHGPREWTSQQYPDGTARHPVASVTWYEADAYCRWRDAALPTLFEWEKAARGGAFTHSLGFVLPWGLVEPRQSTERRANFGGTGTVPVDAHPFGISPFGAYAMAGNVREWTVNPSEDGFIAMGGSWQELSYVFSSVATPHGLFASPALGFRCALRSAPAEAHGGGFIELARRSPSYEPVDEATFRSFLDHYVYDPVDLRPETLETVRTDDWTRHKIRFDGVDGSSILAYLYLPVGVTPPYQTMVLVPSFSSFFFERVDEQIEWTLGPSIRAGRAAFSVVMDGMVERQDRPEPFPPSNTVEFRNLMVRHATELRLGLDYLETRDDIETDALAYVGVSWGAGSRSVFSAVDDRWDAVVFIGGGIDERVHPTLPEALNVNFLPYIDAPKLMVSGRHDEEHPWLTRGLPFWELLREPKQLALFDEEGHHPSDEVRVPAINGFLDDIFGPVR